jgi:hypothetical protein
MVRTIIYLFFFHKHIARSLIAHIIFSWKQFFHPFLIDTKCYVNVVVVFYNSRDLFLDLFSHLSVHTVRSGN